MESPPPQIKNMPYISLRVLPSVNSEALMIGASELFGVVMVLQSFWMSDWENSG